MPKFEVIEETDDETPPEIARIRAAEQPAPLTLDTILMGLKALPQRTAFALSNCFALLTVATVFWLALLIIPYQPDSRQLAGLAGYAIFVIAINLIVRHK